MDTIKVFDNSGRLVKKLINNEMIRNSGSQYWEGTDENGLELETGMYLVWVEVFSEYGATERFKQVVVLSR
jgi:flagellar hook assembly protein FlgD